MKGKVTKAFTDAGITPAEVTAHTRQGSVLATGVTQVRLPDTPQLRGRDLVRKLVMYTPENSSSMLTPFWIHNILSETNGFREI